MQTYSLHDFFSFLFSSPAPSPILPFPLSHSSSFFTCTLQSMQLGRKEETVAATVKPVIKKTFVSPPSSSFSFFPSPGHTNNDFPPFGGPDTKKKLGRKNAGEIRQKKRSAVCLEMRNKFLDTRRCGRASHYVCFFLSFFLFISPKISTKFFSPSRGEANCPPDSEMNGSSTRSVGRMKKK